MVGLRSRSTSCTASSSSTSVRVQSPSTSAVGTSSAMANVRSRSEKRSPLSTASEPTAAPATTRSSSRASCSTQSRRASRCSTVNTLEVLELEVLEAEDDERLARAGADADVAALDAVAILLRGYGPAVDFEAERRRVVAHAASGDVVRFLGDFRASLDPAGQRRDPAVSVARDVVAPAAEHGEEVVVLAVVVAAHERHAVVARTAHPAHACAHRDVSERLLQGGKVDEPRPPPEPASGDSSVGGRSSKAKHAVAASRMYYGPGTKPICERRP